MKTLEYNTEHRTQHGIGKQLFTPDMGYEFEKSIHDLAGFQKFSRKEMTTVQYNTHFPTFTAEDKRDLQMQIEMLTQELNSKIEAAFNAKLQEKFAEYHSKTDSAKQGFMSRTTF